MLMCHRVPPLHLLIASLVWVCLAAAVGCNTHPESPEPPQISPTDAGLQAIAQYDKDGDGKLNKEELEASPGLKAGASRVDTDGDGMLSAEEITKRIEYWLGSGTTIMSGNTQFFFRGGPLRDAEIVYEPESFLGPSFKPSTGTTDKTGVAYMQGQDSQFPGVYLGFYRVKVSKMVNGSEVIPSKYNTKTELGCEISDDIYYETGMLRFNL